jgi:hypothetical protein
MLLRIYRFGAGARFDGGLIGALQRADVIDSVRVLDALFVSTDEETGDVAVFDACGGDLRTMTVDMLDFRLDADARQAATAQALDQGSGGVPADTLRAVAEALEPGGGMAAVLLTHGPSDEFDEAVERAGGGLAVASEVGAARLADVASDLQAAAAGR